jgi:hypothetical protein
VEKVFKLCIGALCDHFATIGIIYVNENDPHQNPWQNRLFLWRKLRELLLMNYFWLYCNQMVVRQVESDTVLSRRNFLRLGYHLFFWNHIISSLCELMTRKMSA